MSDVDANIRINIETARAQAQLRALQTQVATLQKTMAGTSMANMGAAGAGLASSMPQLKGFNNEIVTMASNTKLLDKSLAGASRGISDSFTTMRQSITKTGTAYDLAVQKANLLNRKYKEVGRNLDGVSTVVRSSPLKSMATDTQIASQRLSIFNRALQQGSTSILNWGKNMQWAGRQLMVGFTVPLTIAAGLAAKAFMDLEREFVNFKRVYGDFDTPVAETERMTEAVRELSIEMSRLGFTAKETTGLAADAAATGLVGDELLNVTRQATNLATLGMISQDQALNTMISLNSAFKIQGKELENTVNFLNAVENQTVLALSDVTEAIPLVAPVIQGLGGDVQDLAVMLTAMREGGIGANEAANALKTSLARLITPAKAARDRAEELGINLNAIVEDNEGDLMGMINALAQAMDGLSDLDTQKLLSDLFGKRQFARMGALFTNIADDASQAQRVIELTTTSTAELAALADKELGAIAESSTMKFTAAIEQLKVAIAPIGEAVLKLITPVLEFGTKVANWFNDLGDNAKKALGFLTVGIGVVIPGLVMFIGLMGNLTGILLKGFQTILNLVPALRNLGGGAEYLSNEQLEAANAAAQLNTQEAALNTTLSTQATIVGNLVGQYNALSTSMRGVPGGAGPAGKPPIKMATGGKVPGTGNTDKVPALLTPGEFVVNKSQSDQHRGFLTALNSGAVRGFSEGTATISGSVGTSGIKVGVKDLGEVERMFDRLVKSGFAASEMLDYLDDKIKAAAVQGESLGRVIKDVKTEIPGFASYGVATEKSHVADPIARGSKAVGVIAERGVQKANTGVLELLQALERLGVETLESAVDVEVLGNAVSDLPKSINQATKDDGVSNAGFVKTQFTGSQRQNPSQLFDRMQGQLMSLGMNVEEANMAADQMGTEFLQMVDALPDDTIIVESEQLAQEMREAREAAGQTGPEIVSINKMMDQASQKVSKNVTGFGENWKILKEQAGAFRIKWKQITDELLAKLKAQGIHLTSAGGRDGTAFAIETDTTKAKGIAPKTVKSSDTLHFSGGKATGYTSPNNPAQKAAIANATRSGKEVQEAFNQGKESANGPEDDSFIQSQDEAARNSPHPQATVDGTDDGNAYIQARNAALDGQDIYMGQPVQPVEPSGTGLAGSPNQSNQRLAALQNQRAGTTQQAIVADQKVVAASNKQVVAQNRFSSVLKVATAAMQKVAKSAKGFGKALVKGSGKLSAATGAMTGLVFAASMIPGPLQELSQQIMPATFALMAVQQLIPLLTNPWILLVAAVAAFAGGMWYVHKAWQDTLKKTKDFNDALVGSRKDLEALGEVYGSTSNAAKEQQRQIAKRTGGEEVDSEALKEAQDTLTTDFGKKLLEQTDKYVEAGGTDAAAEGLANRLTRAVLDGVITTEQARALANAVGTELENKDLTIETIAEMNELIGPDGSRIENNEMDIYVNLITSGKNMEGLAAQAQEMYANSSWFSRVGSAFFGGGVEQLFAKSAAESATSTLQQIEEAQASLNQRIREGSVDVDKLKEDLEDLRGADTETNTQDQLNKAKEEFEFDRDEVFGAVGYSEFFQGLSDGLGNMGLGKKVADELKEGIVAGTQELDNIVGKDGLFGIDAMGFDISEVNVADPKAIKEAVVLYDREIEAAQKKADNNAYHPEAREAARQRVEDLEKEKLALLETTMQYYDFAQAVNEGKIEGPDKKQGETWADVFANFREESEIELDSLDEWLKTEFMEGTSIYDKVFGDDADIGEEFKDRLAEATMIAMQNGVEMDDVFKAMGGNLLKTVGYLEDMDYVASEAFDKLPKEDKKKFLYEMATDTGLFNEDLLNQLQSLPLNQQRDFLLKITTAYQQIGKPDDITTAAWGYMTNEERKIASLGDQMGDPPKPKSTGSSGNDDKSGGGGDDNDWLEQLAEDTAESKILYGKIVEEGKGSKVARLGYIQWLRESTGLTEEAIQALAKDKEAREKFKKMSEDDRDEVVQKSNNNAFREERDEVRAREKEEKEKGVVQDELGDSFLSQTIQGNEVLLKLYNGTNAEKKKAVELGKRIVELEYTQVDEQKKINNQIKQQNDYLLSQMKVSKMVTSMAIERAALGGKTMNDLQVDNNVLNKEAAWIRATQIEPQEELIDGQEDLIDGYEREIDKVQEVIDGYQREVDHKQRKIDLMNREDELRMRESDMLSHDLKLMGYQEEAINDTYNARIEALTKVQQINQNIAKSQQTQLGLADALSRGDIGAAAQAAAQMQSQQADFAAQAFSSSLETARDSAVNSLTGQDSGLTRDQIDDRQRVLEEQSYQNKLATLAIEDEIYNIQEKIYGQEVLIEAQEVLIADANKKILGYQDAIAVIEDGRLSVIEDITKENDKQLAFAEWQIAAGTAEHDKAIGRAEQEFKAVEAINDLELKSLEIEEAQGVQIKQNLDLMNSFGKATARAMKAIKSGEFDPVKYSKKVGEQSVKLAEQMKTISFDATKYEGMIGPETTASFNVSQTASPVSSGIMGGIAGNVTNNFMNNSVRVDAAGANANEVADIVIRRLEIDKMKNTGG